MHNIYEETGIMKNTKICKIGDLQEEKALVIRGENKYLSGIIIYKDKQSIHIWRNDCPHANLSLDIIEGKVQSKNNDFSPSIDKTDKESLKATVTIPLFKGGKNYSSLKKSKFKKEQSNLILQDTINEVETDTANSWSAYKSLERVLKATQAQAAEIANEGITLEYDSGNTRTTLEVIQSRRLLMDARISNAIAERNFAISKFELLTIIGELTIENLKKPE